MRKVVAIALTLAVCVGAALVHAQEATYNAPTSRTSEAKYKIRVFTVTNLPNAPVLAYIEVSVQDSSNAEIRSQAFTIPDVAHPSATVAGLATAMNNVRATETGTDARKQQFRILGYLFDQGYFPNAVTLAP